MDVELNAHEARVLGVLIEKAFTTPDQYPLTLNATTSGCNQKSNRNPVTDFSEAEVIVAFQGLQMKHLCGGTVPAGSRVEKWHHTAAAHLSLSDRQLAILAELILRGPQAPGELRTRAHRMAPLESLEVLTTTLSRLIERGIVRRLPPAPGSRAERYTQLLAKGLHPDGDAAPSRPTPSPGPEPAAATTSSAPPPPTETGMGVRVAKLEEEVRTLRRQLHDLAAKLGEDL